jgi:hypothetical protein
MKKTVFVFGGLSGFISGAMMLITLPLLKNGTLDFGTGEILGYSTIVLSFLMIFFGIRSYRENQLDGTISFGKAFRVGLLITLVSCVIYVIVWEIIYFGFDTSFGKEYANYMIQEMKDSGASAKEIAAERIKMKEMMDMYNNPFMNVLITFMEPFPIGLILALISAGILRKKPQPASA